VLEYVVGGVIIVVEVMVGETVVAVVMAMVEIMMMVGKCSVKIK